MARFRPIVLGLVVLVFHGGVARAGMFSDVVEGLRFAGFIVDGTHVESSNTSVFVAASNLQGNTIDLGDFDFALAGPVSLVIETGGRSIPEVGFTLSTGLLNVNPNQVVTVGDPVPLIYGFNFDSGTNETQIAGNMLFDLRGSINTFGSYDLRFQNSVRQTTIIDGRFEDLPLSSADFDLGPIDIQGNIFADILATLTDPFFDASGTENVFAAFSGRTFRETQAKATVDALRAKVEAGGTLTDEELSTLTAMQLISNALGDELPSLAFIENGLPGDAGLGAATVPEPGAGLLLASAFAMLVRRRRTPADS